MRITRMVLALSLLVSIATPVSVNAGFSDKAMATLKASPLLFLAASAGRLYWKDPSSNFKARYNIEKLYDINFAQNSPKEYLQNFWYFYDDGFVGHIFKDKELMAKFREDGSTYFKHSRKRVPMGVLGWTASGIKTQEKTVKFLVPLAVAAKLGYGMDAKEVLVWMGLADKEKAKESDAVAQLVEQNKQMAQENKELKDLLVKTLDQNSNAIQKAADAIISAKSDTPKEPKLPDTNNNPEPKNV